MKSILDIKLLEIQKNQTVNSFVESKSSHSKNVIINNAPNLFENHINKVSCSGNYGENNGMDKNT